MSNSFSMPDLDGAQEHLRSFDAQARKKGEAAFSSGRVLSVEVVKPSRLYAAKVQEGSRTRVVKFEHSPDAGWYEECDCKEALGCEHAYAGLKAMLAEHSLAEVRDISAGAANTSSPRESASPRPERPGTKSPEFSSKNIAGLAEASLGRSLTRDERRFCAKITEVYQRVLVYRGRITSWDMNELSVRSNAYGWEPISIWPSTPGTEHEFWLWVVYYGREHGWRPPGFLEGVSNSDIIARRLEQWRQQQEVDRWSNLIRTQEPELALPAPEGYHELRLAFGETSAYLEVKRPGAGEYSQLGQKKISALLEAAEEGTVALTPESSLLSAVFSARIREYHSMELSYGEPEDQADLGRLLRAPVLQPLMVAENGEPLARPSEPLRWEVSEAEEEKGYWFKLAKADGTAPGDILGAIPGNPPLYITPNAVYSGPRVREVLLSSTGLTLIPAAAVETADGVRLLNALKVPLPQRIAERVRTVPMIVTLSCELGPLHSLSETEVCRVSAEAAAVQGKVREKWTSAGWVESSRAPSPSRHDDDALVYHDRSMMDRVPGLLEPLGLRADAADFSRASYVRVTKAFPDLFSAWIKSIPPEIKLDLKGELASFANAAVSGSVRLNVVETEIDWFDLSVIVDVSDTALTPEEIRLLLRARGKFVRLGDKGWRRLQFDLSDEEDQRLANLGLNPRELSDEPQRLHALQLADAAARKFLPEHQAEQIQRRASEIKARVTPPLPEGVKAELRPYQIEGFHFLAYLAENHFGGILADDMGLGKTLQTLAWVLWLREQSRDNPIPPTLVVCPKSVMDNWLTEAARFTPSLRVKTWSSIELDHFIERLGVAEIHVLNYNQLRTLGESLIPVQWLAVILDEGQYIKNPSSQTAQAARALRAGRRLILSGTPIENRLLDLWSLMAFSMPGVLGSRAQFAKLYDAKGDPLARRRLSARVRPFLLRRSKSQVAKDLPDRVEEDLLCEIEGEQKALYKAELKRAQRELLGIQTQKQLNEQRFNFLTSLLRLRQICCHPALINPETKELGAKMEALLERIEPLMEEGHKVLVFSQFVELLSLLKPDLKERGWKHYYLAGETENRGDLVREFQSASGGAVFLISLRAGGFGLNLTAASYVVLFDPWWNPAVENQAIDRTHRIGQTNKVIAYRLLIKDSIEDKIRALQKRKSALAQDVLGEEGFSQALTLSDFQFLLSD